MKLVIKVQDITLSELDKFNATLYPAPGFYRNTVTSDWLLVYPVAPSNVRCVISLGTGSRPPFPCEDYAEPAPAALNQVSGISANDMLKAIAISQNPLLAKELLK